MHECLTTNALARIFQRELHGHNGHNGLISVADFLVPSLATLPLRRPTPSRLFRGGRHASTVAGNNSPFLSPRVFNILLEGVVEERGSAEGKRLWDLWCRDPSLDLQGRHEAGGVLKIADSKGRFLTRLERNNKRIAQSWKGVRTDAQTEDAAEEPRGLPQVEEVAKGVANMRSFLPPGPSRADPNAWIESLERFLPVQLRQEGVRNESPQDESLFKLETLLRQARQQRNIDVLSYLGVHQDRWDAVIWIVKSLMDNSVEGDLHLRDERLPSLPSLPDSNLEALTLKGAIWAEKPERLRGSHSFLGLDYLTDLESEAVGGRRRGGEYVKRRDALALIWQSLGHMILAAADLPMDLRSRLMFNVRQIIAYLHHVDAIPETLYNYTRNPDDMAGLSRPPTIHLLSSRILTSLSDAVWRAHEEQVTKEAAAVGAQYTYLGHEIPGARYKLRVRELGPEIWMELVLWSCVEGGYFAEASSILSEMRKRKGEKKWSLINWEAIKDPSDTHHTKFARVNWDLMLSRYGGAVGAPEGYSADPPFVEMGDRTISSEIVAAVVDGLVDNIHVGVGFRGISPQIVIDYISILKNMLERDRFSLGGNSWNSIIIRLFESGVVDPEINPELLERIVVLAPIYLKELQSVNAPSNEDVEDGSHSYVFDQSAAAIGLLHYTMDACIQSGKIHTTLRIFNLLQSHIDANKRKSIDSFAEKLQEQLISPEADGRDNALAFSAPKTSALYPPFPPRILANLVDLLTKSSHFEIINHLLFSQDIDGPTIPEYLYGHPLLAPKLINFATRTQNHALLASVASKYGSPLGASALSAMLESQIKLTRWNAVHDLLSLMHKTPGIGWRARDVALLARAVLSFDGRDDHRQAGHAKALLRSLLCGNFGPPYRPPSSPSATPSHSPYARPPRPYAVIGTLVDIMRSFGPPLSSCCPLPNSSSWASRYATRRPWRGSKRAAEGDKERQLWTKAMNAVRPNIATVRIIMEAALRETSAIPSSPSSSSSSSSSSAPHPSTSHSSSSSAPPPSTQETQDSTSSHDQPHAHPHDHQDHQQEQEQEDIINWGAQTLEKMLVPRADIAAEIRGYAPRVPAA